MTRNESTFIAISSRHNKLKARNNRTKSPVTLNEEKTHFPVKHLGKGDYQFYTGPQETKRK